MQSQPSHKNDSLNLFQGQAQKFIEIYETSKEFNLINDGQWEFLCRWALEAILPENDPPIPSFATIDAVRMLGFAVAQSCDVTVPAFDYPPKTSGNGGVGPAPLHQVLQVLRATSSMGVWGLESTVMPYFKPMFLLAVRGFSQKYGEVPLNIPGNEIYGDYRVICESSHGTHVQIQIGTPRGRDEELELDIGEGRMILHDVPSINEFIATLERMSFFKEGELSGRYVNAKWSPEGANIWTNCNKISWPKDRMKAYINDIFGHLSIGGAEEILSKAYLRYGKI